MCVLVWSTWSDANGEDLKPCEECVPGCQGVECSASALDALTAPAASCRVLSLYVCVSIGRFAGALCRRSQTDTRKMNGQLTWSVFSLRLRLLYGCARASKGGKYGLGERTDGLLDLFSNPDGFFVGVVAVAALVGLAVLAGPPPQGYEQEYRDEIGALWCAEWQSCRECSAMTVAKVAMCLSKIISDPRCSPSG